jgi:class 3 adenylate cyclase/tetratricopeptide (TPR) repeat protein
VQGLQRTLATVLFTDIVGSTARAAELGDRGWRELLFRHDEVIRGLLRRWTGVEINTAGDGFVARFVDPAYAIACAWEIREALREINLPIRAGLHMGQVEGTGKDAVGIAVHVGARVAAAAESGEILVSRTVHDAVEGADFGFEDRGAHDLKGVPGDRRLFRVTRVPNELLAEEAGLRKRFSARISRRVGVAATLALATILVGLYAVTRVRDPQLPEAAADAAPAVAVLPFTVQGADLDLWREGMVDVLSTNLDGAAGIRAIDSRTVLARWRETVPAGETVDLARALEIARRTGARYALLGSVVASGPNMRLVADLYDARSGKSLGQGQVEGAPDSIFGLVDRLSIEILGAILEEHAEGLPEIRLASVTTGSVPALKAFLMGEIFLRQGDFDDAVDAYQQALASDSTFALAAYRLSEAYGWSEGVGNLATQAIERAARLADRLPERERVLVRGALALERGTLDGIDILREAVRLHPDDAEAWYLLGDMYFHFCGMALLPQGESDRALVRAIALDPRFAPAYVHQINAAFRFTPDSARVARLIDTYGRLAPGTASQHRFQLVFALAFGDSSSRARAMAAIDTTSIYLPFMAHDNLSNARFLETKAELLKVALEDPDLFLPDFAAQTLFETLLFRGRLEEALVVSQHPAVARRGELLYEAHARGFPVSEDELATELALASADTGDVFGLLYAGVFAAERGRWGEHRMALARLRSIAQDAGEAADSTQARLAGGAALALEGVEAWRRGGRLVEARRILDRARTSVTGHFSEETANRLIRWWLAEILIESGEPREAARYFRALASGDAFVTDPVAALHLGRLYEKLGENREARDEYEYFLTAWRDPDPSLRVWVEEARRAMTRLQDPR